jgi:hypothetical protein
VLGVLGPAGVDPGLIVVSLGRHGMWERRTWWSKRNIRIERQSRDLSFQPHPNQQTHLTTIPRITLSS